MAKNQVIYRTQSGRLKTTTLPGTGTTAIYTAGANGSMVKEVFLENASITGTVSLIYNDGSTDNTLNIVTNPSGNVDMLATTYFPKTPNGQQYFMMNPGDSLKVTTSAAASGGIVVYG